MSNRETLRRLAAETLAVLDRGTYAAPSGRLVTIAEQLRRSVEGVRLYRPGEIAIEAPPPSHHGETHIEVTPETTLEAARRLAGKDDVACLNFASAKNPGGGFRNGARAQEESLARASGLYPTLLAAPDYYETHRARRDPLYSDHVIYSPGVPVFRDEAGAFLEEPCAVAFITSPAPNRGATRDPAAAARIPEVLRRRAGVVLATALRHGHRRMILGAWGCGVFRNDPEEVAGAFRDLLVGGPFAGRFTHIVFAVFDPPNANRPAFERAFGAQAPNFDRS